MTRRHPDWLKVKIGGGAQYQQVKTLMRTSKLHTICEEAKCPNIAECFGNGTAVFLILGDVCTRACRYCNVAHGSPSAVNEEEPDAVANSVEALGLKYVVVTSVTRDDLPDGGANVFSKTIRAIRQRNNLCKVEVLIPDFQGDIQALRTVLSARPDVLNHNIEVVEHLFPDVRPQGNYQTSLRLLRAAKAFDAHMITKSGLMVGLGEITEEIIMTLKDLRAVAVDVVTIGQYLQPTKSHAVIKKYYTPEEFRDLKTIALDLGFTHVEAGPLIRSSYHAEQTFT
ncbi:MAG TPA: lipoyl synthase [Candidatus Thermoplasmatota archaeon]|nr:lipoyl synthase [Candidatus Thermoplasmatota archaeon]